MTFRLYPLLTACAASALLAARAVGPKAPDAPLPPHASGAFVSVTPDTAKGAVVGSPARAYADACSANAQIRVAGRSLARQQEAVDRTRRLLDSGAGGWQGEA